MENEKYLYIARLDVTNILAAIKLHGRERVTDDITAGIAKAISRIEPGDERLIVELVGALPAGGEDNEVATTEGI